MTNLVASICYRFDKLQQFYFVSKLISVFATEARNRI